tara:strand:- start:45 stop:1604 length:1560 start_codon:yes stop_codon:yes gene_type:complete
MYSNKKEIQNRLHLIFSKISSFNSKEGFELVSDIFKNEVLKGTAPRSSSFHKSIELALMLLSNNELSNIFWKSYAQTYLVSSSNIYFGDLNISHIRSLISKMEKESKSNESLKEALESFERFIISNGLLKNLSKNYIEFNPNLIINNIGATAALNDSEHLLGPIIFRGKSMLSRMIFNIYGLKVVSGRGLEDYIHPESIPKSDINYLIKRNLIKDVPHEYKENYKNYFEKDLYDFNSPRREYIYSFIKTKELEEKISMESYGFDEAEDDLEIIVGFKEILEFNLIHLYYRLEDSSNFPDAYMVEGAIRHAINTLRQLIKYKFDLFHNEDMETISVEGLTLIAGLSNQESVKNILNQSNSELKKIAITKKEKNPFGHFETYKSVEIERNSAIQWLRDSKRRYEVYELIEDEKPLKNIDYTFISEEIDKAKERIEKSKKEKITFNDSDRFARTDKEIFGRVAQHNKDRWEWIGKGKTFKELNEKNSTYRKNIKRKTYQKNKSPINHDILYDLNSGYIKQIK